jgi:hypothetical protein
METTEESTDVQFIKQRIHRANLPQLEKEALTDLVDRMVEKHFHPSGGISEWIERSIKVQQAVEPELADMEREIDSVFAGK